MAQKPVYTRQDATLSSLANNNSIHSGTILHGPVQRPPAVVVTKPEDSTSAMSDEFDECIASMEDVLHAVDDSLAKIDAKVSIIGNMLQKLCEKHV